MITTGIVKRIDYMGRVAIPKPVREMLKLQEGTPMEIFYEKDGTIILVPYEGLEQCNENVVNSPPLTDSK